MEPDDAEEDNTTRLSKSAVHDEYLPPSETFEVKSKSGKKIKVTKWKFSCNHFPKVFEHNKHWGLLRHQSTQMPVKLPRILTIVTEKSREPDKPVVSKQLKTEGT